MIANSVETTGQISASLASFSRTIDDYAALAKSELIPEKKEKAMEREKSFRTALSDFRQQFESLRKEREETVSICHSWSHYKKLYEVTEV